MIDPADERGRARLEAALGVRRWVDEVAVGGPYRDVAALVAAGERASSTLTDPDLDEAVAHRSRISEHAAGDGSRLPAGEQAGLRRADEGPDAAIARGTVVYEQRFGRVFLIRAHGRSRQDVADELDRRLKNDPATEAEEAKQQLGQIASLRLEAQFGGDT